MICVNFNIAMMLGIYAIALVFYAIYMSIPKKVVPVKVLKSDGMLPKYLIDMNNSYQQFYRYVNFNNTDGYKAICELEELVNKAKNELEYARQQKEIHNSEK